MSENTARPATKKSRTATTARKTSKAGASAESAAANPRRSPAGKPAAAGKAPTASAAGAARPAKRSAAKAVPAKGNRPAAKAAPAIEAGNGTKQGKKKVRLVRDSFTMPETTYEIFASIKKRCLASGVAVKKSEVLRAALAHFGALSDKAINDAIGRLEAIRTGRPPKSPK